MRQSVQLKASQFKREKTDKCELCNATFGTLRKQHQCKRCLRAVCADCSKEKAVVIKIIATDKGKHRLCDICKKDAINQKRIRDEQKLKFCQDSQLGLKWLKMVPPKESLNADTEIKDFEKIFESMRNSLNYSWFDMIYFCAEKIDKKQQMESVKRVVQSVSGEFTFQKGMIDLAYFLLTFLSELNAYAVISYMYSLLPDGYKTPGSQQVQEDMNVVLDILENNYKVKDTTFCQAFLQDYYQTISLKFLSNWMIWESYMVFIESLLTEKNIFPIQNCLALMCNLSQKQLDQEGMIKNTNEIRVREFLTVKGGEMRQSFHRSQSEVSSISPMKDSNTSIIQSITTKVEDTDSSGDEKNEQLQEDIMLLQTENQQLQDLVNKLQATEEQLGAQIKAKDEQIQEISADFELLESKFDQQSKELKELKKQQASNSDEKEKFSQLQDEINKLKIENEAKSALIITLEAFKHSQESQQGSSNEEVKKMQEQVNLLQSQLKQEVEKSHNLEQQQSQQKQINEQESEALKKEIQQLKVELQDQEKKFMDLTQQFQQSQDKVKFQQDQINSLSQDGDSKSLALQTQMDTLRLESESKIQAKVVEISSLNDQIKQLQTQVDNLQKQEIQLKTETEKSLQESSQKITSINLQNQQTQEYLLQAQIDLKQEKDDNEKLRQNLDESQRQIQSLQVQYQEIQRKLEQNQRQSEAHIQELDVKVKSLTVENDTLFKQQSSESQVIQERLREEISNSNTLRNRVELLQNELELAQKTSEGLLLQLDEIRREASDQRGIQDALLAEKESKIEDQIREVNEQEQQIRRLEFDMNVIKVDSETERTLLQDQLRQIQQQIQNEIEQRELQQQQYQKLVDQYNDMASQSEKEIKSLNKQLASHTDKFAKQDEEIREKTKQIEKLHASSHELHHHSESARQKVETLEHQVFTIESERHKLELENQSQKKQLEDQATALEQIRSQMSSNSELEAMENLFKTKQAEETNKLILEHTKVVDDYKLRVEELEELMKEKDEDIDELRAQNKEYEQQIEELQAKQVNQEEIERMEKKIQELKHRISQEQTTINHLRQDILSMERKHNEELAGLNLRYNEREIEIETKDDEILDLKRLNRALELNVLQLQNREQDFKSTYKSMEHQKENLQLENRQLEAKVLEIQGQQSLGGDLDGVKRQLEEQIKINEILIDRMTRMSMDIVEQIQFVRKYKPNVEEIEAVNSLLRNINPKSGPLFEAIYFVLV